MRFEVDLTVCRNLGQCTFSAPELFALDGAGELSFRAGGQSPYVSGEIAPDQEESARDAADMCPTLAITILED